MPDNPHVTFMDSDCFEVKVTIAAVAVTGFLLMSPEKVQFTKSFAAESTLWMHSVLVSFAYCL
jgi:hypothetical protein